MIGILCSQRRERLFANYLRGRPDLTNSGLSVIVFSMPNLNLNDVTVYGMMVSGGTVKTAKTKLPSRIINFAVQYTKSHRKKLRYLAEAENTTLINPANSFNQWSIMKMLASDPKAKPYILPVTEISRDNPIPDLRKINHFILRPQNGSKFTKTIYCGKAARGYDVYNLGDIVYSHLYDIQSAVPPVIRNGKWLLLSAPDLITANKRLLVLRGYLQRSLDGRWTVVCKTVVSMQEHRVKKADKKTDAALLKMISAVSCFIPDLAFCAVDCVLDSSGKPYFLGLGGWQNLMPGKKRHRLLFDAVCRSITAYADDLHTE